MRRPSSPPRTFKPARLLHGFHSTENFSRSTIDRAGRSVFSERLWSRHRCPRTLGSSPTTSTSPARTYNKGYGLTESTGGASGTSVDDPGVHGLVGLLAANMEAKIVDVSSGECLPPGQPGELWLRGPTIMSGYIGDDEATASTLDSEGWLKTGDLCYFDHNGHLFIEDRLKELIKYKAYQVPPAELEDVLQSHPEIVDAAVVPYPHEEAGQIPMAFVVKQPRSTLTEEQVMDFVAKQVAPYKKVRRVAFVSAIPKSAAGKILRRELVNQAASGPTSKL